MTTTEITSEDVAAWMKDQLAKAHEMSNYSSITIGISAFRASVAPAVDFRVYLGEEWGSAAVCFNIDACFAQLANQTPKSKADLKREAAAKLLAEAEELERGGL